MGTWKNNEEYLDSSQKYFMGTCKSNEEYLGKSNEENINFLENIWGIEFFCEILFIF